MSLKRGSGREDHTYSLLAGRKCHCGDLLCNISLNSWNLGIVM